MRKLQHGRKNYKVVAVLPCRINSTRLVAKPLQLLGKNTILELLIKQIKKSKFVNEIILAISENHGKELFVDVAKRAKVKYIFGNENDVLGRLVKAAKISKADVVLRTTSENPFIYWEGIDPLITSHIEGEYDFSYQKGLPLGSGIELINFNTLKIAHDKGKIKHRGELSTLYFYENQKKFKINKNIPEKKLRRPEIRLTVDTPQDLVVARIIFENALNKKNPVQLKKIIKFLDNHPKIKEINSQTQLKYKRYM